MGRFDQLHTTKRVQLADRIAALAINEEKTRGKPILYLAQYNIAKQLGVHWLEVANALRLAYTAEFFDTYGYGFVGPGPGRSGDKYGYVLFHNLSKNGNHEGVLHLDTHHEKVAGYLLDSARKFQHLSTVYANDPVMGPACANLAFILKGTGTQVEMVIGSIDL